MYAFNFEPFFKTTSNDELEQFLETLEALRDKGMSRNACELFSKQIGLRALPIYNDGYYQEVLYYQLGLLLAHRPGHEAKASEYIEKSSVMCSDGGQQMFSDHIQYSLALFKKQGTAIERNVPSFLLASMPKSGSASLSQTIAALADIPVLRLSAGEHVLMQSWVRQGMRGGMVTHEHCMATPHNLNMLRICDVRKIAIQLRDPRAAAYSFFRMRVKQKMKGFEAHNFHIHIQDIYPFYAAWSNGWLQAAKENPWLSVHWIHYQKYQSQPRETVLAMLEFFGATPALQKHARHYLNSDEALSQANFQQGDDNAWRKETSEEMCQMMWDALSPDTIKTLQLTY